MYEKQCRYTFNKATAREGDCAVSRFESYVRYKYPRASREMQLIKKWPHIPDTVDFVRQLWRQNNYKHQTITIQILTLMAGETFTGMTTFTRRKRLTTVQNISPAMDRQIQYGVDLGGGRKAIWDWNKYPRMHLGRQNWGMSPLFSCDMLYM